MAKSNLGKLVSRVGASGGGKTYSKARPTAYYSVLSIIVILGLSSVVYSRYERQHPVVVPKVYPAKGAVGYFALSVEVCGTAQKALTPGALSGSAYAILTKNVVRVSPTTQAQAGANATVGAFIKQTPGLVLTAQKLVVPTGTSAAAPGDLYKAGSKCATGTKYAGKKAYPELAYWTTLSQRKPSISSDPSAVVLTPNMLVTLAFEPKGVTPKLPSNATIAAMYAAAPTTTTTTTPVSSTTTTLVGTTTTVSGTTTTVSGTTTTTSVTTTTAH